MSTHANMVKMTAASPGTGTITLGSASSGHRTFAQGYNSADATVAGIRIEDAADSTIWEVARDCAYTHTGTTLGRGTFENSSTGSLVNFTGAVVVSVVATANLGNSIEAALSGYINGLELLWNSATSISVGAGAAHIESSGNVLPVASSLTASSLSLTANTWYHVYLYNNSGTAAIEVVTTAPAAVYFGTARSKTGASTHRYLGSIRAVATDTAAQFSHDWRSNQYLYKNAVVTATYRVLSAGTATTDTSVDFSALVPSSSRVIWVKLSNTSTNAGFTVGSDDVTQNGDASSGYFAVAAGVRSVLPIPCSSDQKLSYDCNITPDTGGAFIDVVGYQYSR